MAVSTGSVRSGSAVSDLVQAAAKAELATYAKYGAHAEAKEASQAAMMWNLQVCARAQGRKTGFVQV